MAHTITRADAANARRALGLPSSGAASVRRTSPAATQVSVSYASEVGDLVQRAPRMTTSFRAACGHLGVQSSSVHRIVFDAGSVHVSTYGRPHGTTYEIESSCVRSAWQHVTRIGNRVLARVWGEEA